MLLNMLNDLAEATKASDGKKKWLCVFVCLFVCCFCFVVFALLFLVCFLVCSLAGTVSGLRTGPQPALLWRSKMDSPCNQHLPRLNECNDLAEAMKALDGEKNARQPALSLAGHGDGHVLTGSIYFHQATKDRRVLLIPGIHYFDAYGLQPLLLQAPALQVHLRASPLVGPEGYIGHTRGKKIW